LANVDVFCRAAGSRDAARTDRAPLSARITDDGLEARSLLVIGDRRQFDVTVEIG
jgi:hypothetical protein